MTQPTDPTGLTYDRGDVEETTTAKAGDGWAAGHHSPLIPLGTDPLCGHLPGEPHDDGCEYWRGVALGHYPHPDGHVAPVVPIPAFNLRQLAEQHTTAADIDRRERGAA